MTHVTCTLTAKNRDQPRNPTLGLPYALAFTDISNSNHRCKKRSNNFLKLKNVYFVAVILKVLAALNLPTFKKNVWKIKNVKKRDQNKKNVKKFFSHLILIALNADSGRCADALIATLSVRRRNAVHH